MIKYKIPQNFIFFGVLAIGAATILVGAQLASAPFRSSTRTAAATLTKPTISPLEMMIGYDTLLSVENWDAS